MQFRSLIAMVAAAALWSGVSMSQQQQQPGPALEQQLAAAEQRLQQAHEVLSSPGPHPAALQDAMAQVRETLAGIEQAMLQGLSDSQRTDPHWESLQNQIDEARRFEAGPAQELAAEIRDVLNILPNLQRAAGAPSGDRVVGAPAMSGSTGAAAVEPAPPGETIERMIGRRAVSTDNRDVGVLETLLVDQGGTPRLAVIEWGGFAGLGQRRTVVPWDQIRFNPANDQLILDLTRDQLEAMPRYEEGAVLAPEYGELRLLR